MGLRSFVLGTLVALLGPTAAEEVRTEEVGLRDASLPTLRSGRAEVGYRVEGPGFLTWQKSAREAESWARELGTPDPTVQRILTACGLCGRISGADGQWRAVASARDLQAELSHGFCPECARRHHPDLFDAL